MSTVANPSATTRRLVFVGGLHRSGTTVLARLLADHPDISGFSNTGAPEDEGEHLQSVYPDCWEFGGVGRFAFAPAMHLTEHSPLVDDRSRAILWSEWSRWWDLSKEILIEKSPPNMLKMRFLQALYPTASFVLIMRHPVAVTGATLKWRSPLTRAWAPHSLIDHWARAHEVALSDARHVRRFHIMSYEDLVAAPDRELDRLAGFLDLRLPLTAERVDATSNLRYFDLWERMRTSRLRGPYIRWLERRYEGRIQPFGYSFASAEARGVDGQPKSERPAWDARSHPTASAR